MSSTNTVPSLWFDYEQAGGPSGSFVISRRRYDSALTARRLLLCLLMAVSLVHPVAANTAERLIAWQDLTIPVDPSSDPFFDIEYDQRKLVEELLAFERSRASDGTLDTASENRLAELMAALHREGLDAAVVLKQERGFRDSIVAQRSMVRTEIDGQSVRIPGFVVPLAFDGTEVTEFLLVPYAGACVHTPPPPANQIIHVRPDKGFAMGRLFDPVLVSGVLTVEPSVQSAELSDGNAGFNVGYAMQAREISAF